MDQDTSDTPSKPHLVIAALFWIFLLSFFGGGMLMFIHLFVPFLGDWYYIIAIVIAAEFLILLVAGLSIRVLSALRGGR